MKHYPHSKHNGTLKHGGALKHLHKVAASAATVGHGHVTIHTGGPGSWMNVPNTPHMPQEQKAPTKSTPIRQRKQIACP